MYNSSIGSKKDENDMCCQSEEVVAKSSQLSRQHAYLFVVFQAKIHHNSFHQLASNGSLSDGVEDLSMKSLNNSNDSFPLKSASPGRWVTAHYLVLVELWVKEF